MINSVLESYLIRLGRLLVPDVFFRKDNIAFRLLSSRGFALEVHLACTAKVALIAILKGLQVLGLLSFFVFFNLILANGEGFVVECCANETNVYIALSAAEHGLVDLSHLGEAECASHLSREYLSSPVSLNCLLQIDDLGIRFLGDYIVCDKPI